MILKEATYQDNIDQLNRVFAYLFNHQQMTYIQKQQWDNISKITDPVTKYQKLMTFMNNPKNKFPDPREVLKKIVPEATPKPAGAKSMPLNPGGGISPERMEQQIKYYNYAIKTLYAEKKLNKNQWKEYLELAKSTRDQESLLNALTIWYKKQGFPTAASVVQKAQAAYQQKSAAAQSVGDVGVDLSKLAPEKQKLMTSYINYLEKLTGKKVTFT
jgi:hypothetical protein